MSLALAVVKHYINNKALKKRGAARRAPAPAGPPRPRPARGPARSGHGLLSCRIFYFQPNLTSPPYVYRMYASYTVASSEDMNENVKYSYSVRVYCEIDMEGVNPRYPITVRREQCIPHEPLARLRGVTTGGSAPGRRHGRRAGSGLRWSCGGATAVLRRVLLEQGLAE